MPSAEPRKAAGDARSLTWEVAATAVGSAAAPVGKRQELVRRCLVDTVAVALAAARQPVVVATESTVPDAYGGTMVVSSGRRVAARDAAFLNGVAMHALDYDDVIDELRGHPSSVILPALLAVAEQGSLDFDQFSAAYERAAHIAIALARGLNIDSHYSRGWHSSSVIGVVAATAGLARLTGLSVDQASHAVGIAASMAAGIQQNFGSGTKAIHVGHAASSALQAVNLALAGVGADPRSLEGSRGYLSLFSPNSNPEAALNALGQPSLVLQAGITVKRFACCVAVQALAEAALTLVGSCDPDKIASITVSLHPGATMPLITALPMTADQARFSVHYVVAVALINGEIDMDSFSDDQLGRADVQALMNKICLCEVTVPPIGDPTWDSGFTVVEIQTVSGKHHVARVNAADGHATRPLAKQDLLDKLTDCVRFGGRPLDITALVTLFDHLPDEMGLSELIRGLELRLDNHHRQITSIKNEANQR